MSGVVHFIGRPVLEALTPQEVRARKSSAQIYRMYDDFSVELPSFGLDVTRFGAIVIPRGFETDFASIPRFALWYVDDDAPCILYGAITHDYLYSIGGALPLRRLTREECDHILRICMLACGARTTQAAVVYRAVRLRGAPHWNERKSAA